MDVAVDQEPVIIPEQVHCDFVETKDKDVEVWMIRCPPGFDTAQLNGLKINVAELDSPNFPVGSEGLALRGVPAHETANHQVVFPDIKGKRLRLGTQFSRQFALTHDVDIMTTRNVLPVPLGPIPQTQSLRMRTSHPGGAYTAPANPDFSGPGATSGSASAVGSSLERKKKQKGGETEAAKQVAQAASTAEAVVAAEDETEKKKRKKEAKKRKREAEAAVAATASGQVDGGRSGAGVATGDEERVKKDKKHKKDKKEKNIKEEQVANGSGGATIPAGESAGGVAAEGAAETEAEREQRKRDKAEKKAKKEAKKAKKAAQDA